MKEKREKRLESEFRKEIYGILTTKIKNPDITEMFSITDCRVNNDLSEAVVYVSVFSADKIKSEKTFAAIKDSAREVRAIISSQMHIRTVPKFNFVLDTSYEYGARIDSIIDGFTYGETNDDN
ncbi:MAG: 30S ribosome-binding factor RbfA [Clostridia bacterium]|nr:30S ribosome-binding factor RbfA [Clostridia bacterium]